MRPDSREQNVDVASADAKECGQLLGETKRLRGWVDAFEALVYRFSDPPPSPSRS